MKKSDLLLVTSLVVLVAYLLLSLVVPGINSLTSTAYQIFLDLSLVMGYPGALIVSFVGNATILVPFPYVTVSFVLGGLTGGAPPVFLFDPLVVGLLSGVGAALGEMTGYVVGYTGGKLIDEDQRSGFKRYVELYPKKTPLVLWFLAVTPIPDDVLLVPLGAAKYPWWKVLIPQLIGKFMFLTAISYAGRFGLSIVEALIGSASPTSFVSRLIEVSALLLVVLAIYALVRIDWASLAKKE
ncbi:hypothetical protein EU545_02565 [Candidatus Thorarchaeota archaeon]|jgi:membrane protein YqaA with SNARE-associated domain|nr:MAG: hypothetical protein EU545_02565 [Candidatus Thorarchaeota archaeon]